MEVWNVERRCPHPCSIWSSQMVPEHTLKRTYANVSVAIHSVNTAGAPTWPSPYQVLRLPQRTETLSPRSQRLSFYPSQCTQQP